MKAVKNVLGHVDLLRGGSVSGTIGKIAQILLNARTAKLALELDRFRPEDAGEAPDYELLESWLSHPERPRAETGVEDANHLAAEFEPLPPASDRPCDCFFVVDSCYTLAEATPFMPESAGRRWNLPLGHRDCLSHQMLVEKVLEQMRMRTVASASCFNRTCRIYAPVYRQVAVVTLAFMRGIPQAPAEGDRPLTKSEQLRQALDLAYDDVRRAFVRFVDDPANADRPFVLVGHSQGTAHLIRLLQHEVEGHPARLRRFVHAYLPGFGVPLELFSRSLRMVRPSVCADDVRTVSSWRTASATHPSHKILKPAAFYAGSGWQVVGEQLTSNPISWAKGPEAAASDPALYRGALWPLPANLDPRDHGEAGALPSGTSLRFGHMSSRSRGTLGAWVRALVPVDCGRVIARADADGFLRIPELRRESLFSLTERDWLLYHDIDCALFHRNLQENVARRVEAWGRRPSRL